MTISFFVAGVPKPAGSKNAFAIRKGGIPTGQVAVTDASGKAGKLWRKAVSEAAREAMQGEQVMTGAVGLTMRFFMPRPKCHYRTGKNAAVLRADAPKWHVKAPDTTKLLRSVEDGLKGIVWVDDCQVVFHDSVYKEFCRQDQHPGVNVTVWTIGEQP